MSRRVLVVGLGRFGGGVAAARWFAALGDEVTVTDRKDRASLAESAAQVEPLGVRLRLGGHDPGDYDRADVVVVNPAIPFDDPLIARARARGKEIVTEMGLTLRRLPGPVVGITGTKGKSTTASLCAAMLGASGRPAILGGNIGRPLLNEAAGLPPGTVAVLEISSFQLAWLEHDDFAPVAVVVTNVTGDHLDRHPGFDHYAAAKERLVRALPPAGLAVLRRGDPVCEDYATRCRGRVTWFGPGCEPPVPLDGLRLPGRHNRDNASAAAHAALAAGATPEGCTTAISSFEPLPHRLNTLREIGGVCWVDDSVSTTPESTAVAVESFTRPVILLAGGRDKGCDWRPLLDAARRVKAVVAYGETGPRLRDELPGTHLEGDLDGAVRRARALAQPGDVVLLSPGFSSYDAFPGFDARAAHFRKLVDAPL